MKARLIQAAIGLFARLPLPACHALGGALGMALAPTREGRVAATNLRLCLPELTDAARARLWRQSLRETGRTFAETGRLWQEPAARSLARIRRVHGEPLLDAAREAGRGVVILSPHLGAWELAGLYLPTRLPTTSLYRPPRQRELEPLMQAARQRSGARLVPTDARGVRALYRALERGECVGILPDQNPGPTGGVFAPFFGQPAWTMTLVNRLLRKSGARALYLYAERLPRGAGYELHILPAPPGLDDSDPVRAATALNQGIEACVRRLPAQYQWTYKRFRVQPDGQQPPY